MNRTLLITIIFLALFFALHPRNTIVGTLAVLSTPFILAIVYLFSAFILLLIAAAVHSAVRRNHRHPHTFTVADRRRGRGPLRRR